MSYKLALFAFPSAVSDKILVNEFRMAADTLSGDVDIGRPSLALMEVGGIKFAELRGSNPHSHALRDTVMDCLSYLEGPHAFVGYDDQSGVSLFEYINLREGAVTRRLSLLSDGPLLGGDLDELAVAYPQKGFSNAELEALSQKDDADLSEREFAAVSAYDNAAVLGLREAFSWQEARAFTKIAHVDEVWTLESSPRQIATPVASGIIAWWPQNDDYESAGLTPR